VIRGNRQSPEVTFIGQRDRAVNGSDRCTGPRVTCLKELLNTWQTTGRIATDTTLVEGTHCRLGNRLTKGLSSNNPDGIYDCDQVAGSHGLAVALRTNTGWGLAGQNRANLNFSDASVNQLVSQFFSQICASLSNDVAFSILDIGCNNAARG